jgi:hypothetical protein
VNKRLFSDTSRREKNRKCIKSFILLPNSLYSRYLNWKTVIFKRPSGPSSQLDGIKEEAKQRALKAAEKRASRRNNKK